MKHIKTLVDNNNDTPTKAIRNAGFGAKLKINKY